MRDDQLVPSRTDASESSRVIGGRYRLERTIGRGGMGYVWAGTDVLLKRPVAVKELRFPPGLPEREAAEMRERALREARAMATLNHPNTVLLYDVAREHDQPFVVMELVAGQSLSQLLKTHRMLNQYQVAVFVDGVAAALQTAHRAGIVHRDIKPGNVLLGPLGQVKLADFGLSRNVAEATMTRSEMLVGTPSYLPPEIARHRTLGAPADLWSLGATLFAAAEGGPPYEKNKDPLTTISSIVHGPIPRHHQSGPIAEVLSGLLVKDPARRMPLAEVRHRLRDLVRDAGETPFEALLNPATATTERIRAPKPQPALPIPQQPSRHDPAHPSSTALPPPVRPLPPPAEPSLSRSALGRLPVRSPIALAAAGVLLVVGAAGIGFLIGKQDSDQPTTSARNSASLGASDQPLQAERAASVGRTVPGRADGVLGPLTVGDVLRLDRVDFGTRPAIAFEARLRSSADDAARAHLDLRLDGPDGELIGQLPVAGSRGDTGWKNVATRLSRGITGTHSVYLLVGATAGEDDLLSLDWIRFHR